MNRRTSAGLLGGGGVLLLAVTGLALLDVYVAATLPAIPETTVLSEETLVPVLGLAGALVAWGAVELGDVPPLLALPIGGGLAALVVRLGLGLATASLDATAGDLALGALQTFALGLAVGAVAASGLTYPDRIETAGAAVLALGGVVIASTAFGTTLSRVVYTVLAALLGGAPIALGVHARDREGFGLGRSPEAESTGGADPGDPFGAEAGRAGGAGGTAGAGGGDRGGESPDDGQDAEATTDVGGGPDGPGRADDDRSETGSGDRVDDEEPPDAADEADDAETEPPGEDAGEEEDEPAGPAGGDDRDDDDSA